MVHHAVGSLDASWPFGSLQEGRYRCILADPPWHFQNYSAKGEGKNPVAHYPCMGPTELAALPVAGLAHPDGCALTMWATAPLLPLAIQMLAWWGFEFKSAGAWAKQSSTGQRWAFGPGYCYRAASEFWLLGTRGNPRPMVRNVRNLIIAPVREHSRKPDEMRKNCESLWQGPRCELFARETAPGWDAWGNQVGKFDPPEQPPTEEPNV